jgi:hypothetical protein
MEESKSSLPNWYEKWTRAGTTVKIILVEILADGRWVP